MSTVDVSYFWRGEFCNEAVNRLHAEAFRHRIFDDDWWARVNRHSLGWVCAKNREELVGFVNVAWDGALHAFILDTMVASTCRHLGIATHMLAVCAGEARNARCEWLHVDFGDPLRPLYFDSAGFTPTNAGLIKL
jgi:ribosomal protein S18 acetylase RimI-like enzyme